MPVTDEESLLVPAEEGRTIRVFLPTGDPRGIRTVEVTNRTIKAIMAPRHSLAELGKRPEANRPGVYLLLGSDQKRAGVFRVYVGESNDAIGRQITRRDSRGENDSTPLPKTGETAAKEPAVKEPAVKAPEANETNASKPDTDSKHFDWTETLIFVSNDNRLTKAHVRWLEANLYREIKLARKATLDNRQQPTEDPLPEDETAATTEFLRLIALITEVLGYDIFITPQWRSVAKAISESVDNEETGDMPIFHGQSGTLTTRLMCTSQGYVVLKGSQAAKEVGASLPPSAQNRRDQLVEVGDPELAGDTYVFTTDVPFASPTAASNVVAGYTTRGPHYWRLKTGQTLMEWEAAQLPADTTDEPAQDAAPASPAS